MSLPAIKVQGLGKRYQIGAALRRHTFREAITEAILAPIRRIRSFGQPSHDAADAFWALKDVSFEVQPGEVVGVIGANGAGKSTLLKILSQITYPTEGRVELRGRVGSLLEVGTGFHRELSGRENIYMNGAILGMTRSEITRKFDEIVAFSGVEKFIDTPVKHYSSGMYVRLAFAVAAHLEPEILLVDEVLAVGDAEFRKKCMGKMSEVAGSGRTILFVSHSMTAIESLCERTLLLKAGRVEVFGPTEQVIARYLGQAKTFSSDVDLTLPSLRPMGSTPVLTRLRFLGADGKLAEHFTLGDDVLIEIRGYTPRRLLDVTMAIRINGLIGQRVATCHTEYQHREPIELQGKFVLRCRIRKCPLMPMPYMLALTLKSGGALVDEVENQSFELVARDVYGTGKILPERTGFVILDAAWEVEGEIMSRET